MSAEPIVGSHAVLLTGYDDSQQRFSFQNSWGTTWGDRGFGTFAYSYFDAYQLEAWAVVAPGMNRPHQPSRRAIQVRWGIADTLGKVLHCAEVLTAAGDESIAWAFLVHRDGFADVEEFFVRPVYRGLGYGSVLAAMVAEIAQSQDARLRLWVTHADAGRKSEPAFQRVLEHLGLALTPSGCRWAAYKAEE